MVASAVRGPKLHDFGNAIAVCETVMSRYREDEPALEERDFGCEYGQINRLIHLKAVEVSLRGLVPVVGWEMVLAEFVVVVGSVSA